MASKPAARNRLRIIGGRWRGRKLSFTPIEGLRPTPDRIRETLFNWLQGHIQDANVLDLFAGSGALGLEALSRGASTAVFVDQNPDSAANISSHLALLQCHNAQVLRSDVLRYLTDSKAHKFGVVFLDPPFDGTLASQAMQALEQYGWLSAGAWVYAEVRKGSELAVPPGWKLHRSAQAGQVACHLYQRAQG